MTSTQTRRARDGVDVPSRFAAIDAVKGQPEIAQSDVDVPATPGPPPAASGNARPRPHPPVTWPAWTAESPLPGSRDGERGRRAPQHLRPGQETEAGMADFSPRGRGRPHVVVVGGGFAGLAAVHGLRGVDVDVTLIDRHTYNTFQPLLYQVATATLNPVISPGSCGPSALIRRMCGSSRARW